MHLDLGITGLGLLVLISLVFGVVAQVLFWKWATHWLWLIGAAAWLLTRRGRRSRSISA